MAEDENLLEGPCPCPIVEVDGPMAFTVTDADDIPGEEPTVENDVEELILIPEQEPNPEVTVNTVEQEPNPESAVNTLEQEANPGITTNNTLEQERIPEPGMSTEELGSYSQPNMNTQEFENEYEPEEYYGGLMLNPDEIKEAYFYNFYYDSESSNEDEDAPLTPARAVKKQAKLRWDMDPTDESSGDAAALSDISYLDNTLCYPTKVAVRRLPPMMTEEEFMEWISPLAEHNYFYYQMPCSKGEEGRCSARINFLKHEDAIAFIQRFHGAAYIHGLPGEEPFEYFCSCEFSLIQFPQRLEDLPPINNPLEGTLYETPEWLEFVELYERAEDYATLIGADEYPLYTQEEMLEQIEYKNAHKNDLVTTPLVEAVVRQLKKAKAKKLRSSKKYQPNNQDKRAPADKKSPPKKDRRRRQQERQEGRDWEKEERSANAKKKRSPGKSPIVKIPRDKEQLGKDLQTKSMDAEMPSTSASSRKPNSYNNYKDSGSGKLKPEKKNVDYQEKSPVRPNEFKRSPRTYHSPKGNQNSAEVKSKQASQPTDVPSIKKVDDMSSRSTTENLPVVKKTVVKKASKVVKSRPGTGEAPDNGEGGEGSKKKVVKVIQKEPQKPKDKDAEAPKPEPSVPSVSSESTDKGKDSASSSSGSAVGTDRRERVRKGRPDQEFYRPGSLRSMKKAAEAKALEK